MAPKKSTAKSTTKSKEVAPKVTAAERQRNAALARLTKSVDARNKAEAARQRAFGAMCAAVLKAHDEDGLTYKQIANIVGVSTVRVSQVLTEARESAED